MKLFLFHKIITSFESNFLFLTKINYRHFKKNKAIIKFRSFLRYLIYGFKIHVET
jgi:hypothetical protein